MAIKKTKNNTEDQNQEYFFSDLKQVQIISGISAFSGVLITILAMLFLPARVDRNLIIYTAIFVSLFIAVYYTFPRFYLNPRLMLLPDAVFIITITTVMYALKDMGEFYIVFFLLLITVDAFSFKFKDFMAVLVMIVSAILFSNIFLARQFFSVNALVFRSIIQLYSIIITALIMRFYAKEALTERKEKEKIRRLAQNTLTAIKQLRNLLDNIGNGVFALDKEGKIILTNTAAVNILNWKKAIAGRKIQEIMPLYNADDQLVDPVKKVLETKKKISRSDLIVKRDYESINVYVNVAPLFDIDGGIQGTIVLFRDITKEKELEEQKMEFVAISSHELRTPLTVIEGYLYYILNSNKLKYDKKTRNFIEKSHKSCLALQRLITDLLEVSKIERGRLKMIVDSFDLSELLDETVSELKGKALKNKVELFLEVKNKNLPHVMADRVRIKEVITNLIENAIKFTEKGQIRVGIKKDGKNLLVSVTDTGIGMSKEDQKYIFDKFYRAEGWRTRQRGGTGLGLYISKTVIERFRGKIWVDSKIGKGSTFNFTLPASKKIKKSKEESSPKELKKFVSKL